MYLGLTGLRIAPADMIYSGLATHFVPAAKHPEILVQLAKGKPTADVLESAAAPPSSSALAVHRDAIDRAFSKDSVLQIISALADEGEWGRETADLLKSRSPTSLELTFRAIRRGAKLDFNDCMRMEYRLTTRILAGHDFYEGVRAAVIDKDQKPHWQPDRLDSVNAQEIERHFDSLGEDELSL